MTIKKLKDDLSNLEVGDVVFFNKSQEICNFIMITKMNVLHLSHYHFDLELYVFHLDDYNYHVDQFFNCHICDDYNLCGNSNVPFHIFAHCDLDYCYKFTEYELKLLCALSLKMK